MSNKKSKQNQPDLINDGMANHFSRRKFIGVMGAGSALMVAGASCKKIHSFPCHGKGHGHGNDDNDDQNNDQKVDLGSGDTGVLNYAYALEQLEAAFYIQVVSMPYESMSDMEKYYLTDIRNHEIAHREFFKAALAENAIQDLEVNFSSIDFSDRTSVLGTAKSFEDLGVSAYNGAGKLLTNPDYLTLAGKIVSVEARHAAWIRDTITPGTFADMSVVNDNGLDVVRKPDEVLSIAGAYLKTKLDASNLPTD